MPVTSFDGFQNSQDAAALKTLKLESSSIHLTENATSHTGSLDKLTVEKFHTSEIWGPLPKVEKEGMEFIGWFINGTTTRVVEGDTITTSSIEPRWRNHTLTSHEGKAATCSSAGWVAYVTCSTCSYTTYRTLPKLSHQLSYHAKLDATCTQPGNISYYECSLCNNKYSDIQGEYKIDTVELPATGHKFDSLYIHDNKEHWHKCLYCNAISEKVSHSYSGKVVDVLHLKKSADCTSAAIYYYSCECGENGSSDFSEGEPLGHNLTHHSGVPATCTQEGYKEYWYCSTCEKSFFDEECTNEITEQNKNVIPVAGHKDSGKYTSFGPSGHKKLCSVCESEYGYLISHNIQIFDWGGSDSEYHWHICTDCDYQADRARHNYTAYGTDEVCDVCSHTKQKEQSTSGGFDIKAGTLEPTGQLVVTGNGLKYRAEFKLDEGSEKTSLDWYLDGESIGSSDQCEFETPLRKSYTILCIIYNNNLGNSYSETIYGGAEY